MKLDELKAKNKTEEEGNPIVEPKLDAEGNPIKEAELDAEGNPIEEVELDADGDPIEAVEPWQKTEDSVPVGAHVKVKQKLKGRISERDDEIQKLKVELEALKAKPEIKFPDRPKEDDFDTDEAYQAALEKYEDEAAAARYDKIERQRAAQKTQQQARKALDVAVDSHYERAGKLIEESGISPDVYKETDATVRGAVESIRPKEGDIIIDQVISFMGEGSEKVLYYLGRNKAALNEFKVLLSEDPSGMSAAVYLGQQKERLTNPKKKISKAAKPDSQIQGDGNAGNKGSALKRKYDKAHKEKNHQLAYNLKKEARAAGADVSSW